MGLSQPGFKPLLKGSWDLVTGVIIRITIHITPIKVLITLLTQSRDPPSTSALQGFFATGLLRVQGR